MFKANLHSLALERRVGQPEYAQIKEGPGHAPRFRASVTVADETFTSTNFCKTYKQAQNDAAELAVQALLQRQREKEEQDKKIQEALAKRGNNPEKEEQDKKIQEALAKHEVVHCDGDNGSNALAHNGMSNKYTFEPGGWCKSKLLEISTKHGYGMPIYENTFEGPCHTPSFRATVTLKDMTFQSNEIFTSLRQAEQAAAASALNFFCQKGHKDATFEQSEVHKNLLQEKSQKEGHALPTYKTTNSGVPNLPTFTSVVTFMGNTYQGSSAKTKKQAEKNAAKIAWDSINNGTESLCFPINDPDGGKRALSPALYTEYSLTTDIEKTSISDPPTFQSAFQKSENTNLQFQPKQETSVSASIQKTVMDNKNQQAAPRRTKIVPIKQPSTKENS